MAPTYSSKGYYCLLILVFQNVLYTITMRYVRSRGGAKFIPSCMVTVGEVIKLVTSLIILIYSDGFKYSLNLLLANKKDALKSCIPAIIYLVQNQLLVAALSNLDAPTFQVTYQLKLLTTALFSVAILGTPISLMQWLSLFILFGGVVILEPPSHSSVKPNPMVVSQNASLGLFYVILASFLSGFASIYFELILKGSKKSLWLRNVELSGISLTLSIFIQWFNERTVIQQKGYFYGFDLVVWMMIFLYAFGGMLVAMVVKHADNMLKGFACSISIILSCMYSLVFLGVTLNWSFLLGTGMVVSSVFLYSTYPPSTSSQPLSKVQHAN